MAEPAVHPDEPEAGNHLPRESLWQIFDDEARRTLGISGEEFLRRWDAGDYDGDDEDEPRRRARELEFLMLLVTPERVGVTGRRRLAGTIPRGHRLRHRAAPVDSATRRRLGTDAGRVLRLAGTALRPGRHGR